MPLLRALLLAGFAFTFTACWSDSDKTASEPVAAEKSAESITPATPSTATTSSDGIKCGAPPQPTVCCEAMIPSCNECRDKAQRAMAAWREKCGGQGGTDLSKCAQAPTVECCMEATSECRSCREKALNEIMAWRERCGITSGIDCNVKPSIEQCCKTGEPSCESCRKRVRRLLDEYAKHCSK